LLEAVVALSLLALLVALTLPLYQGAIRDRRVARAAEDVLQVIRFAQQQAVGDVAGCYQVVIMGTSAAVEVQPRDANGICSYGPPTVKRSDDFEQGVVGSSTTSPIEFAGSGALISTSSVTITLASGDRSRTISVEAATGRAQINR